VSDGIAVVLELKPGSGAMPSEVINGELLDGVPEGSTKFGMALEACAAQKTIKAATPKATTGVVPAVLALLDPFTPMFEVKSSPYF